MPTITKSDGEERRINDLLGLVKFCLETTSQEDASDQVPSNVEAMDPDRRAWLQQAIASMTVDTAKQLIENLATVKETIANMRDPSKNVDVAKTSKALEILTDLCEDIDYAKDFSKLDGFSIFRPLIGCHHEELTVKACELIAALSQNNPMCQDIAVKTRLLEKLIDFVHIKEDRTHMGARSTALYAISSIIRSNPEVRHIFETRLDGLSVLLELFEDQPLDTMLAELVAADKNDRKSFIYLWRKLRIRAIFLFRTLSAESEAASKYFYGKQAIRQITYQLSKFNDPEVVEHLLKALEDFLQSLDTTKQAESLRQVPYLRDILERIHKSSQSATSRQHSGDDYFDMTDTRNSCNKLLEMINSINQN